MEHITGQPYRMTKSIIAGGKAVFQNDCTLRVVYNPDRPLSGLHFHEFIEIAIVLSGSGYHCVWNETAGCGRGDVYIINVGVPHNFFAADAGEPLRVINLIFDPADLYEGEIADSAHERYCYGLFREEFACAHVTLRPRALEALEEMYQAIHAENEGDLPEGRDAVRARLTLLLIALRRALEAKNSAAAIKSRAHVLAENTARCVAEHYMDCTLTLETIAEKLFVSKSYLSRMFRQVTGGYFADYLRNIRLIRACSLLTDTSLPNEQIARMCGFKDLPNFYRLFSAQFGMTPGQYRAGR